MIIINKKICGGEPTIKGHRITVANILGYLKAGSTTNEIAVEYGLKLKEVEEAVSYAINRVK